MGGLSGAVNFLQTAERGSTGSSVDGVGEGTQPPLPKKGSF